MGAVVGTQHLVLRTKSASSCRKQTWIRGSLHVSGLLPTLEPLPHLLCPDFLIYEGALALNLTAQDQASPQ